jgi:hypothetical protein
MTLDSSTDENITLTNTMYRNVRLKNLWKIVSYFLATIMRSEAEVETSFTRA